MFAKRLGQRNTPGGILDRARRMNSPAVPRVDLLREMEGLLGLENGGDDESLRTTAVIEKVTQLLRTHTAVAQSLDRISVYESRLEKLLKPPYSSSSNVPVTVPQLQETISTAYCMLHEADREIADLQSTRLKLETHMRTRHEEVKYLRSKLSKIENDRNMEKISILKNDLSRDNDPVSTIKRDAANTIIKALEESEKLRLILEKEVIKLKAEISSQKNSTVHVPTVPKFSEIAELKRINRDLVNAGVIRVIKRAVVDDYDVIPKHIERLNFPDLPPAGEVNFDSLSQSFIEDLGDDADIPKFSVR